MPARVEPRRGLLQSWHTACPLPGRGGIWLGEGAQETLVIRNTATTNLVLDGRDDNPDCGTNKWRNNRLTTTNQTCVH